MSTSLMMRCSILALAGAAAIAAPVVQLDPWGDDSIRVRMAPAGAAIVDPPLMALGSTTPPPFTSVVTRDGALSVTNGNLQVTADPTTGFITATRVSDGAVLLQQTQLVFGPAATGSRPNSVSALVQFAGHGANESVYGLGEHRTGRVNQMPFYQLFQNSQYYPDSHGGDVSIPFYSSSMGYGFLWNLPSYGYMNVTQSELDWYSNATLNADFWITTTAASTDADPTRSPYADYLLHMVDAVGHAPQMPYYATGFIQCKDRYRNQSQLLAVANGYVTRGLPISTIVIDWKHWVNMGDWTLNPACWPDPQGMVNTLQEMGIELMITFWPFQTTPSIHWQQFNGSGLLATALDGTPSILEGDYYLYDATNAVARNTTFADWYAGYGTYGVKTIWLDAAEPERASSYNFGEFRMELGTDTEIGMAWVQQHVRTFGDGFASIGIAPTDYFVLPRHAWAGSWVYSAALWSGDIQSLFSELELQVRVVQGVVMSGVQLWTTDIGGYRDGDPSDPVFQDLIVRWFQFGAFCPLFRLHGHRAGGPAADECGPTNGDNEVWNLAQEPQHYEGITRVMYLRENLREYVWQLSAETAATGMPMLRPMIVEFPQDPTCATAQVEGQFMFGPDWLVAPVTTYGATNWTVYLPPVVNATWVYWWNQTQFVGGQWVTLATPIDEFPLFNKLPVTPNVVAYANATVFWSSERNDSVLCVSAQCYNSNAPGEQGNYVVQSVEGVSPISSTEGYVTINGQQYTLVPLSLCFSYTHDDNYVATNSTCVDATYTVQFNNGLVLSEAAPGAVPLQVWYRDYGAGHWDYATLSSSTEIAWAQANGYTFQWTTGYILTQQPPAAVAH